MKSVMTFSLWLEALFVVPNTSIPSLLTKCSRQKRDAFGSTDHPNRFGAVGSQKYGKTSNESEAATPNKNNKAQKTSEKFMAGDT
mmetsp:Transcript_70071/g.121301  ORF Transcript_70071/g.121301 Transcript_70071/m.121301 type:complete len:85 (-) Transcript_70071:25-279(-)